MAREVRLQQRGRVVEQGPAELLGRAVFCLYPHQTAYAVDAAQLHPLPEGLPPARAVLAANMETALNAIWDSQLKAGDRVAVVGAGVVGLLFGYLASRHPGTRGRAHRHRRAQGRAGARARARAVSRRQRRARGADLVVHASGTAAGLATALALAANEATVLELSLVRRRARGARARRRVPRAAATAARVAGRAACRPRSGRAGTHTRRLRLALRLLHDERLDRAGAGERAVRRAARGDGRARARCGRRPLPAHRLLGREEEGRCSA